MTCSARHKSSRAARADAFRRFSAAKQRGVATLFVSLGVLFLITMVTLYSNRGSVFEQRASSNQYRSTQSFEAAQGGANFAIGWLATLGNTNSTAWTTAVGSAGAAWVSDTSNSPYNQRNSTSIANQTIGSYTAAITLWRNAADTTIIEIQSVATGDSTATVKQIVDVLSVAVDGPTVSPLVVNGCISNVTGGPDVGADSLGKSIVASGAPACLDTGHFDLSGTVTGNGFTGTAWDYTFGISKTEMKRLADNQAGGATGGPIYYYTDATASSNNHSSLGSSASPVILIFDVTSADCPTINGNPTIYGIVYCSVGGDMQGWGGTTIYGSVVTDASITKFTANTNILSDPNANTPSAYVATPIVSRLIGSWRDF